jgi:hypothetical protein
MVCGMTRHDDDPFPDDDDDELFFAVGHAVAAGASLEWSIVELHGTLLHSPRGLIAVAGEGVERARAGCLEMAAIIGPPVEELVREAVLPVKELWAQRNVLVHGAWMAGSHLGEPGRSGITIRLRRTGLSTDGWSVSSIGGLMDALSLCTKRISVLEHRLQEEFVQLLARQHAPFQLGPAKVW